LDREQGALKQTGGRGSFKADLRQEAKKVGGGNPPFPEHQNRGGSKQAAGKQTSEKSQKVTARTRANAIS